MLLANDRQCVAANKPDCHPLGLANGVAVCEPIHEPDCQPLGLAHGVAVCEPDHIADCRALDQSYHQPDTFPVCERAMPEWRDLYGWAERL